MRGVGQQVVLPIGPAFLDLPDLFPNGDERVAEAVELLLRLALGRLDHQGPGYRKRDGWWVKPVVDDALGDVLYVHPGRGLEGPGIDDALVCDQAVLPGVQQRIMVGQAPGNVIGAEDRDLSGLAESVVTHERDIGP